MIILKSLYYLIGIILIIWGFIAHPIAMLIIITVLYILGLLYQIRDRLLLDKWERTSGGIHEDFD